MNIQTDSVVETDIHQHRLYTRHHRVDGGIPPTERTLHTENTESPQNDERLYSHGVPLVLSDVPPKPTIFSSSFSKATSGPATGWETVLLPFNSFVRTNHGYVVEPQTSLIRQRVKSIGIGLTDRVEGTYDLRIHKIWATNGMGESEMEEEQRICGANALSLVEGASSTKREANQQTGEARNQKRSDTSGKGLKGLRAEWE